jgi:hypothetical protein
MTIRNPILRGVAAVCVFLALFLSGLVWAPLALIFNYMPRVMLMSMADFYDALTPKGDE